jgi:hypothetical protein
MRPSLPMWALALPLMGLVGLPGRGDAEEVALV